MNRSIQIESLKTLDEFLDEYYLQDPSARARIEEGSRKLKMKMELRKIRTELKKSQQELSRRSGVPQRTISEIEKGKRNPTVNTLAKLANAMGKRLEIRFVNDD